jgi:undecaprenyl-diphosphatase
LYYSNFVIFFGVYFGWVLVAILFLIVFRARRRWTAFRCILLALATGLIALFVADLIKGFYPVSRPDSALGGVTKIIIPADKESFPSSYAAFFGGLAFALMWRKRKLGLLFLLGAILIGVARVAAGVHYPLDIIAGGLLGFLTSLLFRRWLRPHWRTKDW